MKKLILLVLVSFVFACEAPVGEVGPQGLAGATGAKGDKGDAGEKGAFNAIVSDWKTVSRWTNSDIVKNLNYDASFNEPNLTQQIVDKGLIVGYFRFQDPASSQTVFAIPDETADYSLGISGWVLSNAKIIVLNLNFRDIAVKDAQLPKWQIQARWILVPPASSGRLKNIDWNNYSEVKKVLNIQD